MALRQRIISEIYDEKNNKVVDRQIIEDKKIETPKEIDNIGYNHGEQITILQEIQEIFLLNQSQLLSPDSCPQCGSKVAKGGIHHLIFIQYIQIINYKFQEFLVVIVNAQLGRLLQAYILYLEVICILI